MMPPLNRSALLLCLLILPLAGRAAALPVTVSIPPQAHFVEAIGGEHVDVQVMVPANAEPVTYEPTPRQMAALSQAKLYFAIGVPFEQGWLPRFQAANAEMTTVDTIANIRRHPMVSHDDHAGHDKNEPGDERAGADPHVWLSPALVRLQAESIRDALIQADPDHAQAYHQGFRRFVEQIHAVDEAILASLADLPADSRRFLVFHPAFGYFARSYGLEQMAIEVEGKEPGPRELARIIDNARGHGIRVIFIEPQFAHGAARTIAREIGGEVLTLDPLARDWTAGMQAIAATLRKALGRDDRQDPANKAPAPHAHMMQTHVEP